MNFHFLCPKENIEALSIDIQMMQYEFGPKYIILLLILRFEQRFTESVYVDHVLCTFLESKIHTSIMVQGLI